MAIGKIKGLINVMDLLTVVNMQKGWRQNYKTLSGSLLKVHLLNKTLGIINIHENMTPIRC